MGVLSSWDTVEMNSVFSRLISSSFLLRSPLVDDFLLEPDPVEVGHHFPAQQSA